MISAIQYFPYPSTHVSDTFSMSARVIRIKVFVNVEDETGGRTVRIGDLAEGIGRATGDEGAGTSPVITRHENQLAGGSSLTDSRHSSLDRGGPNSDVGTEACQD